MKISDEELNKYAGYPGSSMCEFNNQEWPDYENNPLRKVALELRDAREKLKVAVEALDKCTDWEKRDAAHDIAIIALQKLKGG